MASGYRYQGTDFDDLFDAFVVGPYAQDCGLRAGGADLSRRYAHISYGAKRADVGYRVGGVDVSNLWATKGTAMYQLPFHGKQFNAGIQAMKGESSYQVAAAVELVLYGDGRYVVTERGNGANGFSRVADQGRWLPAGQSAADYEVKFSHPVVYMGSIDNSAPGFTAIPPQKSISLSVSAVSESNEWNPEQARLTCHLRRRGGTEMVSWIDAECLAAGWV